MSEKSGLNRRHFLSVATSVAGAAGVGMAAVPFVMSFKPSAKAQALGAPVQIDIGKLEQGQMVRSMWRGKPVWVLKRSQAMLERMRASGAKLADPNSEVETQQPAFAQNEDRSLKPDVLVVLGVCTHLGCAPLERFDVAPADLGPDWVGGFYCPCHGSKFDLSGRVYAGVPAPTNLVVPPYRYLSETLILVGDDTGASA
ncbi:MAG: ubiquinol-cytochrome c reductase iron-sulfur subunit [Gammaproteobacteria bacterium]|nr:ubiquinol-cytochrome c reductase iron-sulfur subunit [Gammaproteobacteria bacterium]NND35708.1 ubiquinol-cytochrome c reductase iron-sulfur subunit [Gammaproteobacteria bacterium]